LSHPNLTPRAYLAIYVTLLLLTLSTALIAINLHLGKWEIPVALGIAGAKTVLVGLFFMHLAYSDRLVWLIVAVGVLFFIVMISFTLADYWTRGWLASASWPAGWGLF
jgi:cytochrome c oxidase subunit 4